jgi:hypothetical protein
MEQRKSPWGYCLKRWKIPHPMRAFYEDGDLASVFALSSRKDNRTCWHRGLLLHWRSPFIRSDVEEAIAETVSVGSESIDVAHQVQWQPHLLSNPDIQR